MMLEQKHVSSRTCEDFEAAITEVCRQSFSSQGNSCIVGWVVMLRAVHPVQYTLHQIPYLLQTEVGWGIAPMKLFYVLLLSTRVVSRGTMLQERIVEAKAVPHTIAASLNSRNPFLVPYHTLNMDINSGNLILPLQEYAIMIYWFTLTCYLLFSMDHT